MYGLKTSLSKQPMAKTISIPGPNPPTGHHSVVRAEVSIAEVTDSGNDVKLFVDFLIVGGGQNLD